MPVNPGRLRDRVTILSRLEVVTPEGIVTDWDEIDVAWARVVAVSAEGSARYQQAGYSNVTHAVIMRSYPVTLRGYRFGWLGRTLEPIRPPLAPAPARYQQVMCRELTDEEAAGSTYG